MNLFYGHYRYKNNFYISREDALNDMLLRQDWNGVMTFHYHDEVFLNIDWTVEPPFDIDLLYKMRAQQIRDKYKYVILQLSGGVDSTQILETFIDNNIFIDEIQTFHHHSVTKNLEFDLRSEFSRDVSVLYEYQYAVLPLLKWVREVSPETKIVEVDLMEDLIKGVSPRSNGELLGQNPITHGLINPPTITYMVPRTVTYISLTHNIKRIEKDNVCVIRGIDKPALKVFNIPNNNYALTFNFHDQTMGSTKFMAKGIMPETFTLESFYWSPDAPLIPAKQSHLILQKLRSHEKFRDIFLKVKRGIENSRLESIKKVNRVDTPLHQKLERLMYPIIYPSLRNVSFFGAKPTTTSPEFRILDFIGIKHYAREMRQEYNERKLGIYKQIVNKEQMIDYIPTRRYQIGKF